ncbi:MAG: tetratricopeptide repeat protein [Trueperaceae bacterium]|nr:tetratricopeptide repeat protein [Trueperaceae bacterium]
MAKGELFVQLLGEPGFLFGSERSTMPPDKRSYLLAYLACAGDWVDRERLARLLWPDHEVSAARHNLRQLLKRMRDLPWSRGLQMTGQGRDRRLRWAPPTDLASLRAALAASDWSGAAALYRGPLLEGLRPDTLPEFSAWLELERGRLQNDLRDALLAHAAELMSQRKPNEALKLIAPLSRVDPYDEEALRAYMAAAAAAGNRGAALQEYRRFVARLADELSLAPTAATEQLLAQISAERSVAGEVLPYGVQQTESVPAKESGSARPAFAPSDSSSFIGRELELADLLRLLGDSGCRLLTVTGPGGVGKSRLVRHAADELSQLFADGYALTRAESLTSADALLSAVTQALALPGSPGVSPIDEVAGAIGERRLLLILDDLDGVADAAGSVAELLSRCRHLAILTTSRERLNLTEERLLPIEGLAFPHAGMSLTEALAYDAVRLFVERSQRVKPDYYLAEAEVEHLIRICALVGGLPLGLELSAAWTRLLSCTQIAKELASDLEFLSRSTSDASERHRSIRASFEHSWGRLGAEERRVLAAMTVFRGGFGSLSARLVANAPLAVLAALVDKSLLRADASGTFELHPLLRRFASEKLSPSETAQARDSHARYFLGELGGLSEVAGEVRRERLAALGSGFEDLSVAWLWATGSPPGPAQSAGEPRWTAEELARLARTFIDVCDAHGRYSEGAELLGAAVGAASRASRRDTAALGTLLVLQAWLLGKIGRLSEARANALRGLELLGQRAKAAFGWAHRVGLNTLGNVAFHEGNYEEAETRFSEALKLATAQKASSEMGAFAGNLGVVRQVLGDRQAAAEHFRRQLAIKRELDDTRGVVGALSNLGNVLRLLGDEAAARAHLEEGLTLALSSGNRAVLPNLRINLGVLAHGLGQHAVASEHFHAAWRHANEDGRRALETNALFQLGRVALDAGEPLAAEEWFMKALGMVVSAGSLSGILDNLTGLAWVRLRVEDHENAAAWARVAAEHPAASAGTKSWARDLLAELEQRTRTGADAGPPERDSSVNEAVGLAMQALAAAVVPYSYSGSSR